MAAAGARLPQAADLPRVGLLYAGAEGFLNVPGDRVAAGAAGRRRVWPRPPGRARPDRAAAERANAAVAAAIAATSTPNGSHSAPPTRTCSSSTAAPSATPTTGSPTVMIGSDAREAARLERRLRQQRAGFHGRDHERGRLARGEQRARGRRRGG